MLLMDNPLVIKATIVARVRTCFMKSLDRPIQRRNASEDMAIFHFSWTDYLFLNLLDIALTEDLSLNLVHKTCLNPKFIVPV